MASDTCVADLMFLHVWEDLKENIHDSDVEVENLIKRTSQQLKQIANENGISHEDRAEEILLFVTENKVKETYKSWKTGHRLLLLEAVDICAHNRIQNRKLFRDILKSLFRISECIDRELLYFEQYLSDSGAFSKTEATNKQEYILDQMSGWKLAWPGVPWFGESGGYYLDCPLAREDRSGNTQVLPDALYRRQDPDYILSLLRHGVHASCIYLWPLTMTIDLRMSLTLLATHTEDEIRNWIEVVTIRYFCRARGNFSLHIVRVDSDEDFDMRDGLPLDISYDDLLLLPPRAIKFIPEDRYKSPSPLQHLCRLCIRKQILMTDRLPHGIRELPLPNRILDYVDLLED